MEDYVLFTVAKINIDHKLVMAGGGLLPPYSLRISVFEGGGGFLKWMECQWMEFVPPGPVVFWRHFTCISKNEPVRERQTSCNRKPHSGTSCRDA